MQFKDGQSCLLEFDWDKLIGAYEYESKGENRPRFQESKDYMIDNLIKYNKLSIPAIYHSENKICQIFILDLKEVERYLKLQQLDI